MKRKILNKRRLLRAERRALMSHRGRSRRRAAERLARLKRVVTIPVVEQAA